MNEKKPFSVGVALDAIPVFLAAFIPLFFLPITSEFFEFNKLALIVVATILMLFIWIVKMIMVKKFEIVRSPMDLALLVFLVVFVLATIFSLNKTMSLYGSYGRWFPGLFSVLALVVFYYVTTTNISSHKAIKTALYGVILGATISTVVALLGYYGVKLGSASYLRAPNFTLAGSPTTVAILAALASVLILVRILSNEKESVKYILLAAFILNFFGVMVFGMLASWAVLITGMLLALHFTNTETVLNNKSYLLSAFAFAAVVIVAMIIPVTGKMLKNSDYRSELMITPSESWIVVSSVMRDFPILGTGPSTFGINYTRYKPSSANNTNYWNLRVDKPYSEAFAIISNFGIVGIVVMSVFGLKVVKFALNAKNVKTDKNLAIAMAVGIISLLTSLLFTYVTVATAFMMTLLGALLTSMYMFDRVNGVEKVSLKVSSITVGGDMSLLGGGEKEIFQYIVAIPLAAIAAVGGYLFYKQYAGEYFMRKSLVEAQENNGSRTYDYQRKAITMNPKREQYHNAYANTNLALANALAAKGKLTAEENATIQTLISQSIRSARVATETVSPLSAASWETRGNIYKSLIGVAQDAEKWATRSYNSAIQLDPLNARLRVALGGIYYASKDYLSAASYFTQAINLKSDYANAYYNLGLALKELGRYAEAKQQMETVARLVGEDGRDYKRVSAVLEELETLIPQNVAGAADQQPTVQELESIAEPEQPEEPVNQEPLTNVGEEEPVVEGVGLEEPVQPETEPEQAEEQPQETQEVVEEQPVQQ